MIIQTLVAFVATISFSILFNVPKKQYIFCGITGAIGWLCYLLFVSFHFSLVFATFVAAMILTILSRVFAIYRKVPVTVFLITGIFPLVPGAGIYYTTYYFIMNEPTLTASKCMETIQISIAIALGTMCIFAIPRRLFTFD